AACIPPDDLRTNWKQQGFSTHMIAAASFQTAHQQCMEALQVKSSLVVPVLSADGLFGFLVSHHCRTIHDWSPLEIDFVEQLAAQLELVIERITSLEKIREAQQTAEALSEEQRQQTKLLQQQVSQLISDIAGVSQGDLTVRATVKVGELGDVADFFNLTIERLQRLVTQVKQSTNQVNALLQQNQTASAQLADEAREQTQETARTLDAIQQMTHSTETIANSARQAAEVAHTVAITAAEGEARMDLITQTILELQEVITATAKKIADLGNSSQNISKVTGLIEEIAVQIHQLAETDNLDGTNIADQRPNFARVAEKVKMLATRTSEATLPIDNFLSILQRETEQVVEAVEQSKTKVSEGSQLVQSSKQSLGKMLTLSSQLDRLAQSISEATASQVKTSQAVSSLMQDVAELSNRTSTFSHQTSSALRGTVEVAQELQNSVSMFKVMPDS
ncbi:MAG: methyl-accepting chemotaxis protein, partial [Leptolyngbyaceae cyanobacterium MO_188.B28]|nr:methyl-accepting chemotaxis protein [Leptolyngbyaceae cyanobacterium MO_188.B28]